MSVAPAQDNILRLLFGARARVCVCVCARARACI